MLVRSVEGRAHLPGKDTLAELNVADIGQQEAGFAQICIFEDEEFRLLKFDTSEVYRVSIKNSALGILTFEDCTVLKMALGK